MGGAEGSEGGGADKASMGGGEEKAEGGDGMDVEVFSVGPAVVLAHQPIP
jgi:hypothetical protein